MTINEAIAHEKTMSKDNEVYNFENIVDYHKQIAEWLEELVMFRLESCMIHMPDRLHLVEKIYNKAIDDFADKIISLCDDGEFMNQFNEFTATTILEIAEQLKEKR